MNSHKQGVRLYTVPDGFRLQKCGSFWRTTFDDGMESKKTESDLAHLANLAKWANLVSCASPRTILQKIGRTRPADTTQLHYIVSLPLSKARLWLLCIR